MSKLKQFEYIKWFWKYIVDDINHGAEFCAKQRLF